MDARRESVMVRAMTPGPRKFIDSGFIILIVVTLVAGAAVARRDGWGHVGEVAWDTGGFLIVLLPKVLLGLFVAASIPLLLPRETIASWIGQDSGLKGLAVASFAGILIPGGPSMSFALAAGFLAAGADLGAAVAYVTSWSLLSLNRILIWELTFLPYDFVALRILLSLPVPIIAGALARALVRRAAA